MFSFYGRSEIRMQLAGETQAEFALFLRSSAAPRKFQNFFLTKGDNSGLQAGFDYSEADVPRIVGLGLTLSVSTRLPSIMTIYLRSSNER